MSNIKEAKIEIPKWDGTRETFDTYQFKLRAITAMNMYPEVLDQNAMTACPTLTEYQVLLNQLPAKGQRVLDILCHLVAIGLSGALAWFSIRLVLQSREFHDISSGLDATPLWIPQLGMAIGTTLFALAFLGDLILLLRGEALRDPSAGDEPSRIE